jgi:hypothetical protein
LRDIASAQELLEVRLEQVKGVYNTLHEWHDLQRNVRDLEISFSPCYEEVVQLRREGKNESQLKVSAVERAWEVCKKGPLSQLIEFAKGVDYIGEAFGVEKWIGDLADGQQRIDASIRRANSGDLYDSISDFNPVIIGFRTAVDAQLSKAIERGLEIL